MDAVYVGNNRMLVKPAYGGHLFVPADDMSITPTLVTQGYIEAPLMQHVWNTLPSGAPFVDVGANIGFLSVLAAHKTGPTGRLIAVEANPRAACFLRDNPTASWLTDRTIQIVEAAASDAAGTVVLHQSERFIGYSSTMRPQESIADRGVSIVEVPSVTLDDVLRDVPQIDVLKMDIEGGELRALLGLKETLARGAVRQLVLEWNPAMLGPAQSEAMKELLLQIAATAGATCFLLGADGTKGEIPLDAALSLSSYPFVVLDFPRAAHSGTSVQLTSITKSQKGVDLRQVSLQH